MSHRFERYSLGHGLLSQPRREYEKSRVNAGWKNRRCVVSRRRMCLVASDDGNALLSNLVIWWLFSVTSNLRGLFHSESHSQSDIMTSDGSNSLLCNTLL